MLNHQEFCKRLRQARKDAGMTTTEAACALYTDQSMVTRYETGAIIPRVDRAIDLAELYGVSIGWLCGTDGGKTNEG